MGKLTVAKVKSLVNRGESGRYSDGNGMYLMVPKSGKPYWMLRYTIQKKRREFTLGKEMLMSLAEARICAVENQKKILEGRDPVAERKLEHQEEIHTVKELYADWFEELSSRLKHPNIPKRIYEKEIAPFIGDYQLGVVSPRDVRAIIQKVASSGRPTIANDTLMYLKQLFNHAIKLDLMNSNPAAAFKSADAGGVEQSRKRILTMEELEFVFGIFRANSKSFVRENLLAFAILLVLGVRKNELLQAEWDAFDLEKEVWELLAERNKTQIYILIPLPAAVVIWLKELKIRACGSAYVFPSRRAAKNPYMGSDTLNRAISTLFGKASGKKTQPPNLMGDMKHFTVHDLRRTCRSLLAAEGVPYETAERCINHKLPGVQGVYNRHDYFEERKEAHTIIANLISPFIDLVSEDTLLPLNEDFDETEVQSQN